MSSFVMIRHKVQNFENWKIAYDRHQPKRAAAGLSDKQLLRSADDANEVVLLFEARDLNQAREFIGSPDLRETMQAAGVADKPDILFLHG